MQHASNLLKRKERSLLARVNSWQKRRCEFNHDWLKNQLIQDLGKAINIADGRVVDPPFLPKLWTKLRSEWTAQCEEAESLVRSFEYEMSPGRLFERVPLERIPGEGIDWLPSLTHGLWVARQPVRQWVGEARAELDAARHACSALLSKMDKIGAVHTREDLRAIRPFLVDFRARCQSLGGAISDFPSEIKAA
jgi:hypothetical protein